MVANGNIEIVNGKTDSGDHVFSVIVKRSYAIEHGKPLERLSEDLPLLKTDAYFDDSDPQFTTVQYENDMTPHKKAADIVVIGSAYAPQGKETDKTTIGIRVGKTQKVIQVVGDRECLHREGMDPQFTDPALFSKMELRYERAYGGSDTTSDPQLPFFYPRNMQGCGVALHNKPETIQGLKLPNFENPAHLLSPENLLIEDPKRWPEMPIPQGLGWFQKTWYPRSALIGAYPSFVDVGVATPEELAGLLPKDHIAKAVQYKLPSFLSSFGNGASNGLILKAISKSEKIALRGLSPDGKLDFSLPGETPEVALDIGKGERALQPVLDTVCIRADDQEVDLVWRAIQEFEGYSWFPKMKRLHVEVR